MQVAESAGSDGPLFGLEDDFGFPCSRQQLTLNALWRKQFNPLNMVLVQHGVRHLPHLYTIASLHLFHYGQMLLHPNILRMLFHTFHRLTAAIQCATAATHYLNHCTTYSATIHFTSL